MRNTTLMTVLGACALLAACGKSGETDTAEKLQRRVEHDLYYIENWSLWLDLKILVLTPFRLLNTENAY